MSLPLTFRGPPDPDEGQLSLLPEDLARVLRSVNGFVAFGGGLHVRGICDDPPWHSLQRIWKGENALRNTYELLGDSDIPFGQDCMGDQFLLREGRVFRLTLETAFLENLNCSLPEFLRAAEENPLEVLQMHPLLKLQKQAAAGSEALTPGQLIHAYPPYSTAQAADGVSLRAVSAEQQLEFEMEFFRKLRDLKDGETFQITPI